MVWSVASDTHALMVSFARELTPSVHYSLQRFCTLATGYAYNVIDQVWIPAKNRLPYMPRGAICHIVRFYLVNACVALLTCLSLVVSRVLIKVSRLTWRLPFLGVATFTGLVVTCFAISNLTVTRGWKLEFIFLSFLNIKFAYHLSID